MTTLRDLVTDLLEDILVSELGLQLTKDQIREIEALKEGFIEEVTIKLIG